VKKELGSGGGGKDRKMVNFLGGGDTNEKDCIHQKERTKKGRDQKWEIVEKKKRRFRRGGSKGLTAGLGV